MTDVFIGRRKFAYRDTERDLISVNPSGSIISLLMKHLPKFIVYRHAW